MPVIIQALDRSSLAPAATLIWAIDALLEDQYELCESLARVKPSAYQEAVNYLKKARRVTIVQSGQEKWRGYLQDLTVAHARKRRLMEMLDGLEAASRT